MAIYLGNTPISDIYLGSQQVKSVYLGSTLIWSKSAYSITATAQTSGESQALISVQTSDPNGWTAVVPSQYSSMVSSISPNSTSGSGITTVTVNFNGTVSQSRNIEIEFVCNSDSTCNTSVIVTQTAHTYLYFDALEPAGGQFGPDGGSGNANIVSNTNWTVRIDPGDEWIRVIGGSSGTGDGSIRIAVSSYTGTRVGYIHLIKSDSSEEGDVITITQSRNPI